MKYCFLRFPNGRAKAFTMSYDDGCRADIRFSEIITKYGLKCTFNLTNAETLSTDEVKKYILANGHEIAVHGANHRAEGAIRPIEGITDVLSSRINLEERFERIVRGMAFPDSGITKCHTTDYETIKGYLKNLDIAYARTLGGDNNSFALPTDWHAWMPTAHHTNPLIMDYIDEFLNIDTKNCYRAAKYPKLFYLWGHSYEFDNDNNWDLLESICEKVSGKDDIWYATNIEIYEYVNAYNSLIFSADGTRIYNPTLFEIWFDIDENMYHIKSGETIKI